MLKSKAMTDVGNASDETPSTSNGTSNAFENGRYFSMYQEFSPGHFTSDISSRHLLNLLEEVF